MSDAVEILANKGLIDAMQGYLEIPVTSDRLVTLPRDVEVPVKVNVGDNPSFSRSKLYEFTMNGPGSNYSPTDWAWEDRGMVPISSQLQAPSKIMVQSSSATDDGKFLRITGRRSDNIEVTEVIELNYNAEPITASSFASITRVLKD